MKVLTRSELCKEEEDSGVVSPTGSKLVSEIEPGTTFTGCPRGFCPGTFYKTDDGAARLAYGGGGPCEGMFFDDNTVIFDYKKIPDAILVIPD